MLRKGVLSLDLNGTLGLLFCAYAFSLSFELSLELLLGIKTIFKPFRIIGILILGVFGLKVLVGGIEIDREEKSDVFFYLMIIYGVLISYFRIMSGPFNKGLFYNDLFLVGLNVLVFFVYKNIEVGGKMQLKICYSFLAGVLANSLYIFYGFNFQGVIARQSGFLDNPNYAALSSSAAISFLLVLDNYVKGFFKHVLLYGGVVFLGYIFLITGSRAGLVVLVLSIFLIFVLSNLYRKIVAFLVILGFLLFLLPRSLEDASIAGPLILVKRINKKMEQEDSDVRFVIWKGVFRMLETEGYWGMGLGQYKEKFEQYFSTSSHLYVVNIVERGYFLSTHNDYLAVLTDYGLPSLALYLIFIFFAFIRLIRNILYPDEDDSDYRLLAKYKFILFCSLVVFGISTKSLK